MLDEFLVECVDHSKRTLLKRSFEEGALIKSWLLILSSKGKLNTK